jgi:hypothetical protein
MKLPKVVLVFTSLLFLVGVSCQLSAATDVVNGFGQGNWYSWDTRNTSGTALNGTNDTSPSINSTLLGRSVGASSSADDTAIGQQLIFMQEGQTINGNGDAGNPPPASPTGSLNGLGYIRLDGTGSNSGKSDISYVDTNGIAAATALTDPSFGLSYRYYIQPLNNFRTLGLNIALTNSAQSNLYIFAYVDPAPVAPGGWETSSVSANSGLFRLIANGTQANGGATQTLAGWQSDPNFGSAVFGGTESVFRIGFNVGSGQSNDLQYLDWMQTNLINGGDVVDFQAVPEPTTWIGASLAGLMLIVQIVRARVFSKRFPLTNN